ncbi:MAG TPA: hypothetical protein ENO30_05275 [Thermodesulfobium narugense]|nr:hypothetical protein [Thermodesulfobium narugense]
MAGFVFSVNVQTGNAQVVGVGYDGAACLDDPRLQTVRDLLNSKGLVYNETLHDEAVEALNQQNQQVEQVDYNTLGM